MKEKIKNFGYSTLGLGLIVLSIGAFALLIIGGARLFELIYPILERISSITWGIVWLLLLLSIFPKFRNFTGGGIIIGTYIGGAIFWFLCFYVTYSLWGLLGVFIGVLFFGLGVFFTSILALLFDGQFIGALSFIFILLQIFLFRYLGFWITTKYRPKQELEEPDVIESKEVKKDLKIQTNIIFCSNCGVKIDKDSKFCVQCGNKIKVQ